MHEPIFEGTWEEVSKQASGLRREARVRLEVLQPRQPTVQTIRKGMFPGLKEITEDDFKAAEWRGPN